MPIIYCVFTPLDTESRNSEEKGGKQMMIWDRWNIGRGGKEMGDNKKPTTP